MNGVEEELQETEEPVECGGIWMVGVVEVEDVPEGFQFPRKTCKRPRRKKFMNDCFCCRKNSFDLVAEETGEESEMVIGNVDLAGEKLTRQSAMNFNEADVKKPLASAVEVVKAGNRIVLEAEGGYIENIDTGEKMKVGIEKNVFVYQVQMENCEMVMVTLDSGAGCNVWPKGLAAGSSILKRPKQGVKMIAANGTPIDYFDQRLVKFRGLDAGNAGFVRQT